MKVICSFFIGTCQVPVALPNIFTGVKVSATYTVIAAVIGEFMAAVRWRFQGFSMQRYGQGLRGAPACARWLRPGSAQLWN